MLCEKLLIDLEKSKEKYKDPEKENATFKEKNISLENELKGSKLVLSKFTVGYILDKILESQKGFNDKPGLGYNENNSNKTFGKLITAKSKQKRLCSKCSRCKNYGHRSPFCPVVRGIP